MANVYFLSADVTLGKSFWLNSQSELCKSSYPNVRDFTSHSVPCSSIKDFHAALVKHADMGHCLIKGVLHKDLMHESRAGSTKSEDTTDWICLDLDGAPFDTPQDFIASIPEFKDVSYVVQYSASSGITSTKLSCHIFMMLDGKLPANNIKTWLMDRNFDDAIRPGITLSRVGDQLHYPLDITACQNDKLLYIAPPKIGKGVTCTLKQPRIQLVPGKLPLLPAKSLLPKRTLEQVKEIAKEFRDRLRKEANLPPLRTQIKWVGDKQVQPKPGVATITGIKQERDFVYFNLNGGDSWSYYHPVGNIEFIGCFKTPEIYYYTKDLLPDYYKDQRVTQRIEQSQPTEGGELVLAFRDKRSAQYFNGIWDEKSQRLELHPAKSELQLAHWMQNHNLPPFEVIPVWDMQFNPQSTVIIDQERRTINTYVPTDYFRLEHKPTSLDRCPLIKRIMLHAISGGKEDETFEHWLNWLAVIFQHKRKPKTAWILHGEEGTGKGVIVSRVLTPLLGAEYVVQKRASELEEKFTGWMEKALIAFIDEIEVSASQKKDIISGDLRSFITEDVVTVRHMHRAAVQTPNYTGLIFSSNKPNPVIISAGDRRYNVGFFQPKRLFLTQQELDEVIPKELESFMNYIMTRKADIQTAATALKNEAHALLVESNRTSLDVTANQLANGDLMALWEMRMDLNMALQLNGGAAGNAHLYHDIIKREIKQMLHAPRAAYKTRTLKTQTDKMIFHESKLTRDELIVIFEHCVGNMPKTPNKFTSLLKHRGIVTERMRMDDQTRAYGLRVEWKAPESWLNEVEANFKAEEPKNRLKLIKKA